MSGPASETFAAVDLGSNSFHMIVANYSDGRVQIIDRIKDMVRLASGLDGQRNLDPATVERAVQCLERFGQRIREIPRGNVRAVGTNTLRQARNGTQFLAQARGALGHPIQIIAGREEARLIFLGVAHSVFNEKERRLVVDIGGGSTEVIIGRGSQPSLMESLYMGCVSMSDRFFGDGEITGKRMRRALLYAQQELEGIQATYVKAGWDAAIGASGTILAINDSIRARGWGGQGITGEALSRLRDLLVDTGRVDKLSLDGVSERRLPVFVGGVAILSAVFEALRIDRMAVSDGALREGLLYELIGRAYERDIRDQSISDMAQRYGADPEQARRVADSARTLFRQLQDSWQLDPRTDGKMLVWATQVHEVGLAIAHAQHHYHGAYLLTHADIAGFSRQEQGVLAAMVRLHRRKIVAEEMQSVAEDERPRILRLCVLLRLAVVLCRGRSDAKLPRVRIAARGQEVELTFPEKWLADNPLTLADLEGERDMLSAAGFTLLLN